MRKLPDGVMRNMQNNNMDKTVFTMPTHIIAAGGIVINENDEILLVDSYHAGWVFPGGQVEVGENVIDTVKREVYEETGIVVEVNEVCCISSNTCKYPGYNGVKEVPTKIILDFICQAKGGVLRPSDENRQSAFFSKEKVMELITAPAVMERFKAYLEYNGRPLYLEYVTKPDFKLKLKRSI